MPPKPASNKRKAPGGDDAQGPAQPPPTTSAPEPPGRVTQAETKKGDEDPEAVFRRLLVQPERACLSGTWRERAPGLMPIRGNHAPFAELRKAIEKGAQMGDGAVVDATATRRKQWPQRPPPAAAGPSAAAPTPAPNSKVVFFSGDPLGTAPRQVPLRDFLDGEGFDREPLYVAQMPLRKVPPFSCRPAPPPEAELLRKQPEDDEGRARTRDAAMPWRDSCSDDDEDEGGAQKKAPWRAHLWMSSPNGPHVLSGAHFDDEDNLLCVLPPATPADNGSGGGNGDAPPRRRRLGEGAKLVCLWPPELSAAMLPLAPAGEWANHSALTARDLLDCDGDGQQGGLFDPLLVPRPSSSSSPPAAAAAANGASPPQARPWHRRRGLPAAAGAPGPITANANGGDDDEDDEDASPFGPEEAEARRRRFRVCARPATMRFLVRPGEALFIPAGWWHAVLSEPGTLAVNYWWPPPPQRSGEDEWWAFDGVPGIVAPPSAALKSEDLVLRRALSASAGSLALLAARAIGSLLPLNRRPSKGDDQGGGGGKTVDKKKEMVMKMKKTKTKAKEAEERGGRTGRASTSAAAAAAAPAAPAASRDDDDGNDDDGDDGGDGGDEDGNDDARLEREAARAHAPLGGAPAAALLPAIDLARFIRSQEPCCLRAPRGWDHRLPRCEQFLALSLLRAEARALGVPLLGPSPEVRKVARLLCNAVALPRDQGVVVELVKCLFENGDLYADDATRAFNALGCGLGQRYDGDAEREARLRRGRRTAADAASGLPPMAARVCEAARLSPLAAFLLSSVLDTENKTRETRLRRQQQRLMPEALATEAEEDGTDQEQDLRLQYGYRSDELDGEDYDRDGELAEAMWGAFEDEFYRRRRAERQQRQQQQEGGEGGAPDPDALAAAKQRAFDAIMRQSRLMLRLATRAAAAGAGAV